MAVAEETLTGFEEFSGQLLHQGDAGYDEARAIHNAMIDRRPGLIARCQGVADVQAAVNHARENGLELSVRGGGHNVSGSAITDGGLMLDLSLMRGIHVDPASRIARAQGGVTWAELNRETQVHGLAVTGGVISTTGIAGLTLGGGLGWLLPKLGLATDNLLSAEVVTADGAVLTASEDQYPDLFWGLRGGGGNFGVVTSFEYQLHPVGPMITGGLVIHPIDAGRDLFRFAREFLDGASENVMLFLALVHTPDGAAKVSGVGICHIGSEAEAQAELRPLLEFGSPLDVQVGPMPYTAVNQMLDEPFKAGHLNYWKSSFVRELSEEVIDAIVGAYERCPSPMSFAGIEPFRGAVLRVPLDATAVPHRDAAFNVLFASIWADAAGTDENIAWARESFAALEPHMSGLRYVNYMGADDLGDDPARAAYGPHYDRLATIKAKYDPGNLFRLNQNIRPAT
jgi:FAD/FMN-containing dehydrogenase